MKKYKEIDNKFKYIHNWHKFYPKEFQYIKYKEYIVLAGFEIFNVYETLCLARISLDYIEYDDFGQLISSSDDSHLTSIRKVFMQNSIIYYNICIDLSWQVLWLYYGESSLELVYNEDYLEKALKECSYEGVLYRITLAKQYKLREIVKEFYKYLKKTEIREAYNYIKHKGTFYYKNLGINDRNMLFSFNGINLKMLNRKEIDLNEWSSKLIEFDDRFITYFTNVIDYIMPKDYDKPISLVSNEAYQYYLKVKNYLDNKNIT